jgi:acetolactate synthase-1/2/3 large subunit
MKIHASKLIVDLLWQQGIREVIGIPGAATLHLYDALYDSPIKHILARHEQGAAFIAQGMARTTGKAAVCIATSGPGATNLITAIADAKADSIPLIAITGQVARSMIGTDAFQEVDTFGLTLPITKHNYQVTHAEELLSIIPEAFRIAESGRPGPVLIDIPRDIQNEEIDLPHMPPVSELETLPNLSSDSLTRALDMISQATKPVILAGGGACTPKTASILRQFAEKTNIPVANTLMGSGTLPRSHALSLGMIGMHGERWTNLVLNEADLIIALGTRFGDRSTGKLDQFCPHAQFIHVDIDASEMNKLRAPELSIIGDSFSFLNALLDAPIAPRSSTWLNEIAQLRDTYPPKLPDDPNHPRHLIRDLGALLPDDTLITTDVGQHQMWVAQSYPFAHPRTFLTSGGLGTMGFGLPAAIGAALANPDKRVICFSGDGSIQMNLQELATLAELNLNVTVIIFNNRHLGLVRQIQQLYFNKRYSATVFECNPDFAAIAQAYGIKGITLNSPTAETLFSALEQKGPCVINAMTEPEHNVFPIVPSGQPNTLPQESENANA